MAARRCEERVRCAGPLSIVSGDWLEAEYVRREIGGTWKSDSNHLTLSGRESIITFVSETGWRKITHGRIKKTTRVRIPGAYAKPVKKAHQPIRLERAVSFCHQSGSDATFRLNVALSRMAERARGIQHRKKQTSAEGLVELLMKQPARPSVACANRIEPLNSLRRGGAVAACFLRERSEEHTS